MVTGFKVVGCFNGCWVQIGGGFQWWSFGCWLGFTVEIEFRSRWRLGLGMGHGVDRV